MAATAELRRQRWRHVQEGVMSPAPACVSLDTTCACRRTRLAAPRQPDQYHAHSCNQKQTTDQADTFVCACKRTWLTAPALLSCPRNGVTAWKAAPQPQPLNSNTIQPLGPLGQRGKMFKLMSVCVCVDTPPGRACRRIWLTAPALLMWPRSGGTFWRDAT
jgi:hypothetical protein